MVHRLFSYLFKKSDLFKLPLKYEFVFDQNIDSTNSSKSLLAELVRVWPVELH